LLGQMARRGDCEARSSYCRMQKRKSNGSQDAIAGEGIVFVKKEKKERGKTRYLATFRSIF